MKYLLKKYFIISFSVHVIALVVPAFTIRGSWKEFFYSSLLLTIFFVIIKPITTIVLFPVHLLTLNLSTWIVSAVLIYAWVAVDPYTSISAWDFGGVHIGSLVVAPVQLSYWLSALVICFSLPFIIHLTKMILD